MWSGTCSSTVIEQSELRTREKLLEVKFDVAEMKEVMGNTRT